MNFQPMSPAYSHQSNFIQKVLGYVALAFGLAAAGAYLASQYMPVEMFMGGKQWILYIGIMAMAFTSHMWAQARRPLNFLMFTLFAGLMGVMLWPLLAYSVAVTGGIEIIIKAFSITSLMTLAAGIYGSTTDKDLSGFGGFFTFAM